MGPYADLVKSWKNQKLKKHQESVRNNVVNAQVRCQLPGKKTRAGEHPSDALKHLLDGEFRPIVATVRVLAHDVVEMDESSGRYGICTKYRRTIFNACLNSDVDVSLPIVQEFVVVRLCSV